jgi:membrane protease YdiL (CAAX protease family)
MAARRTGGSGWTVQHRPVTRGRRLTATYPELSTRPLYVLAFLLPLIVLYEAGSSLYLSDAAHRMVETIRAHSIMLGFFQDLGVAGRFVPAFALVTVLLVWHVLKDDPWRLRPAVLAVMVLESFAWTVALVVLIALVQLIGSGGGAPAAAQAQPGSLVGLPWQSRVAISIGAGLYEELLFRMVGMAALHFVLVDLTRMSERVAATIAILLSAAAFAAYHDVLTPDGHLQTLRAVSLLCAGSYFGLVYYLRGFGIVVAVHALYDIFALVLLQHTQ